MGIQPDVYQFIFYTWIIRSIRAYVLDKCNNKRYVWCTHPHKMFVQCPCREIGFMYVVSRLDFSEMKIKLLLKGTRHYVHSLRDCTGPS